MDTQKLLEEYIPIGQSEAISGKELSALLLIRPRELRRLIEDARRAGSLICGDSHGYYFPSSKDEIVSYVRLVRSRVKTECVCLAPFIREV